MIQKINFLFSRLALFLLQVMCYNANIKNDVLHVEHYVDNALNLNYQVPTELKNVIIKVEDRRYNKHYGIDIYAIFRAIMNRFRKKRIEGASTIEQQLVRIITNDRELSLRRKIKEILIASFIAKKYTKDEILTTYVNVYPFDEKCIGMMELCKKQYANWYDIDLTNIIEITARIKYPYLRTKNIVKYLKRVRTIEIMISQSESLNS